MSVFNIESDVFAGWSGNAITALDGNSGTQLVNVQGRQVQAQVQARTMLKRHGRSADQAMAINVGNPLPRIALNLRDCSDTTRKLLFTALTGDGSNIRTSGGSTTVGKVSATIQLWVSAISGATDLELFAPACVVAPEQAATAQTWARDLSLYDGSELVLVATRIPTQTTPALMEDTNAALEAVYFA